MCPDLRTEATLQSGIGADVVLVAVGVHDEGHTIFMQCRNQFPDGVTATRIDEQTVNPIGSRVIEAPAEQGSRYAEFTHLFGIFDNNHRVPRLFFRCGRPASPTAAAKAMAVKRGYGATRDDHSPTVPFENEASHLNESFFKVFLGRKTNTNALNGVTSAPPHPIPLPRRVGER